MELNSKRLFSRHNNLFISGSQKRITTPRFLKYSIFGVAGFFLLTVFPQIAIAIGVLTSNKGRGRRTTLADWTWHQGANAGCSGRGAIAGCNRRVPLVGAIVGCHCSVLWLGGGWRPTLGGVDMVPLLGAIAGWHCSVLWWGEEGYGQLWGSGRGAIAGFHCSVLWLGTLAE